MSDDWVSMVPVLKVEDATVSARFYCDVLGFTKDWEHRFSEDFPLYVSVSRGGLCFHLSEHAGGGSEKIDLYIRVRDVDQSYSELVKRGLEPEGPPEDREYGTRDFAFTDPDGHHMTLGANLQ